MLLNLLLGETKPLCWAVLIPLEIHSFSLHHIEQEVEIRAGGKKSTLSCSCADVEDVEVVCVCVPFYTGFGPALTLHCFNNEGVVKIWQ